MSHYTNDPDPLGHTENDDTSIPAGTAGFLIAAHAWASDILKEHHAVPGVMILGRGEGDEREMLQVFPSSNDEKAYADILVKEAAEFGATFAVWCVEGTLHMARQNEQVETRCALFYSREPGQPIRGQFAVIADDTLGPLNGMLGVQEQRFLELLFKPSAIH